jgi:periplasmic divalent cation tolerance protein
MTSDYRVVLVTVPDSASGEKIAAGLVENKFAACVNVVPGLTSIYRWEGKVEKSSEVLLVIKTRTGQLPSVSRFVKENHKAKVPEIISLPITEGDKNYLDWIGANVLFTRPKDDNSLPL